MDDLDRRLLALVQESFPLVSRPFEALGEELGLSEAEVMARLARLQEEGLVRRIGPVLDLRRLGLSGVLVAARVPVEGADQVARAVSEYEEVSHNYLRPNESGFNLWFTISSREERIREILDRIEEETGVEQLVLPTVRIFKIGVKFDII